MKNLIGNVYGRYEVIDFSHRKGKNYYWKCRCECGNVRVVNSGGLNNGNSTSCGCYNHEVITKHGLNGNKLYHVFNSMKSRCYSQKSNSYKNYGARGITICEEWLEDHLKFIDWATNNGYEDGLTIDRIDVNGNYEPQNCKWVDRKHQNNNTRANVFIEYQGKRMTIAQWAEELNMKMGTLHYRIRIKKWSIEDAFTKPVGR